MLTVFERSVSLAKFDHITGHHLIEAGNVAQQRHAGGVEIDANLVDTRFNNAFQRFLETLGRHIMLIEADADILRIDFDQFAERILQAAARWKSCRAPWRRGPETLRVQWCWPNRRWPRLR